MLDADDVSAFPKLLSRARQTLKDKERMWGLISSAAAIVKSMEEAAWLVGIPSNSFLQTIAAKVL